MKITIVGPGAMGCLFAALLAKNKGKNEIWLLDKCADRSKRIKNSGVIVEGLTQIKHNISITADPNIIGISELVMICTKSYDTGHALNSIKPLLADTTNIISLQNGMGNAQLISDMFGHDRTVCGITAHGSTLISEGKVRHAGKGDTVIGKLTGRIFRDLRDISSTFNEAGISTKTSKDINSVLWSKLVINAGINPLSALCRFTNGSLLQHEGIKEIMRQVVIEATRVAKKNKAKLLYDDPLAKVESVCQATADNLSSMLQDILNKKRTEIDYINGAICRYAKSSGLKTPTNDMISHIIRSIECSYKEQVKDT